MAFFLYRSALFYVLEHAFLFWRFRFLWRERILFRRIAYIWFACMGLFPLVFLWLPPDSDAQRLFSSMGRIWQPFAYFCLCAFLTLDVLRIGGWLARRLVSRRDNCQAGESADALSEQEAGQPNWLLVFLDKQTGGYPRLAAVLLLLGAVVFAYGLYEAQDVRLTRLEVATDKLPPGTNRLRLVFASDLHISARFGGDRLAKIVDFMLAQQPDCILLGGDILDDAMQGTPGDFKELGRLRAPLGSFVVLGNHDAFGDAARPAEALRQAGLTVLAAEEANAGPLRIVGVDDPEVSHQKRRSTHNPTPLLRRLDPSRFTILLQHRPRMRPQTVGLFDLQLSGHTHGGQTFPLAWVMRRIFGVPSGLSTHTGGAGKSRLFVTTGVGFSKLPIRLLVPPEVVVIDLVRSQQQGNT